MIIIKGRKYISAYNPSMHPSIALDRNSNRIRILSSVSTPLYYVPHLDTGNLAKREGLVIAHHASREWVDA